MFGVVGVLPPQNEFWGVVWCVEARIVEELIDQRTVKALLLDAFGNYVVQRALQVAKEPQFSNLLHAIKPCLPALRESAPGFRIGQKLLKKYPQLSDGDAAGEDPRGRGKRRPKGAGRPDDGRGRGDGRRGNGKPRGPKRGPD